ncbi:hypothetical protein [Leadbetterella byssophila]|uniref:Lipoprotein n=1 Tax=Leadbetterella byssophila (strain DSM 17132 / JCM 16389 / KACC 11308 / NBRC 106382 / 4M15) TaxID=649349 RepID=E4RXF3_LEAB4|nr:hypothetical protein [Leadbetterella byssophila]ADQ16298.1 hypothetical protein Lbys_0527 [Leadbetterella byssophila DSM 17132]
MKNTRYLLVLILFLSGCSSKTFIDGNNCNSKELLKTIKNATGTVHFDGYSYVIRSSHDNSYDLVDVGFVCNMNDSLRKDGLKLQFDGQYFKYNGKEKPAFAGTTYYYLSISNVTLK